MMLGYAPAMVSRLFLPWLFFKNLRASFALAPLIRDRRIDLVHCTDIFSLLLLLPAFFTTRIPIVYNVIMFYNRPQSLLFRWLASRMVKRIVAPSQAIRNDLVERVGIGSGRIEVLYNGVDTVAFAPSLPEKKAQVRKKLGIPPDRKVVGLAARYDAGKGHRTFLRAINQLTNHQFLLAGGSPTEDVVSGVTQYREDLEPMFRTLEEQGVLRRLGHWDDMAEFYAALDLFICPSDEEAFGLVVLEAFAAGLPVVVTRTTGAVELVGGCKGVTVIDPKDPTQLAAAVEKALRSGADEVDWEERSEVLKKWTWKGYAKGWEVVYQATLREG